MVSVWMWRLYRNLILLTSLVIPFLEFVRLTGRSAATVLLVMSLFTARNRNLCPRRTTLAPTLRQAHPARDRNVRNPLTIADLSDL